MRRLPLRLAQLGEFLTPAGKGGQTQPLADQAVHGFLHEDFGQEVLAFDGILQLGGGVVAEPEQLLPCQRVLVVLDPLEQVGLVALLGRRQRPAPAGASCPRAVVQLGLGEHDGSKVRRAAGLG